MRTSRGPVELKIDKTVLKNTEQWALSCGDLDLDLLAHVPPVGRWDEVAEHAETFEIAGKEVLVMSIDDLLAVKKHLSRPKDVEAVMQLEAIKALRKES